MIRTLSGIEGRARGGPGQTAVGEEADLEVYEHGLERLGLAVEGRLRRLHNADRVDGARFHHAHHIFDGHSRVMDVMLELIDVIHA